ncbi:MAG: type II toxin-antitoxin system death-on-curing family toxin [bacterium]
MIYLDGEDILRLHKIVIDFAGGSHGVRDAELLASILAAPKQSFEGKELYPDLWQKAAVYLERFARFHVFVDGNKRTALASTAWFLHMNGFRLSATNKEAEKFILFVVTEKMTLVAITTWLKKHSRRTSPSNHRHNT